MEGLIASVGSADKLYAVVLQAIQFAKQQRSIRHRGPSARTWNSSRSRNKKPPKDEVLSELLEKAMVILPPELDPKERDIVLRRVEATYKANLLLNAAFDDTSGAVESALQRLYAALGVADEDDQPQDEPQAHVEELVDMLADFDRCVKAAITIQRAFREYRARRRRERCGYPSRVSSRYMEAIGHLSTHHHSHESWEGDEDEADTSPQSSRSHSMMRRRGPHVKKEVASASQNLEIATHFLKAENQIGSVEVEEPGEQQGEPSPHRPHPAQQDTDWSKRLQELALKLEAVAPDPEPEPEASPSLAEPVINFEDLPPMDKARRALACMIKKPRRVVMSDTVMGNTDDAVLDAGSDMPPAPQVTPAGPHTGTSVFKDSCDTSTAAAAAAAEQPDDSDAKPGADAQPLSDGRGGLKNKKGKKFKSMRSPMFTSLMLSGDLELVGTLTAAMDAAGAQGLIMAIREQVGYLQAQLPGASSTEHLQELPQMARINELVRQALEVQTAAQDARNTIETACAQEVERITEEAARVQASAAMSLKYLAQLNENREAQEAKYQQMIVDAKRDMCTLVDEEDEQGEHDEVEGGPEVGLEGKLSHVSHDLDSRSSSYHHGHDSGLRSRYSNEQARVHHDPPGSAHLSPKVSYQHHGKQKGLNSPQTSTGSAISCRSAGGSKPAWHGGCGSLPLSGPWTHPTPPQPLPQSPSKPDIGRALKAVEKPMTTALFKPSDISGWAARPAPPRTAPSILPRPQVPLQPRVRRTSLHSQQHDSLDPEPHPPKHRPGIWLLDEQQKPSRSEGGLSFDRPSPQVRSGYLPELCIGPQDSCGSGGSGASTPTGAGRLVPTGTKMAPKWRQLEALQAGGLYSRSGRHSTPGRVEEQQDGDSNSLTMGSGVQGRGDAMEGEMCSSPSGPQGLVLPRLGRGLQAEGSSDRCSKSFLRVAPDLLVGSPKSRHASTGGFAACPTEDAGKTRLGSRGGSGLQRGRRTSLDQVQPRALHTSHAAAREEPGNAAQLGWYQPEKLKAWNPPKLDGAQGSAQHLALPAYRPVL